MAKIEAWIITAEKFIPSAQRWIKYESIHRWKEMVEMRVEQITKSKKFRKLKVFHLAPEVITLSDGLGGK